MNPTSFSHIFRKSTVSRRFTIITVMFLTVLLGLLVYTITTLHKDQSTAALIDIAGRQRMLLQKHVHEVFLASQGIAADYPSTRELIRSTLIALRDGGSVVINPETGQRQTITAAPTEELLAKFREQQTHFAQFVERADTFLVLGSERPEFREQVKTLLAQNTALIGVADQAVKHLNAYSESNIATMVRWEIMIAIAIGLLGIFVTILGVRDGRRLENEIEERKRAESALRDSELFLNSIVENIPDMIFVKDAKNLQFLRFNKAGEELIGYPKEAMIGKADYDFFPKLEADFYTTKDREVLSGKTLMDIPEEVIQSKSHGTRYLHTKKIPILDAHGNPEYLLGISEDITEQKQAEEAFRKGERKFRAIYEQAPTGIAISDSLNGRFTQINQKYCDITGYSQEEMLDQTFQDITHPDDLQASLDQMQLLLADQVSSFQMEKRYIRKNGEVIWVNLTCVPLWLEPTDPRQHIAMVEDITHRKQAEKVLQESEERYRVLYERFRILYEDNPSMYFTVAQDGKILSVNGFGAQQLGYTAEELVNQSVLKVFHAEDIAGMKKKFALCLNNTGQVHHWEFRKVRKNGSMLWVKEIARTVRGNDGEIVVLMVCEDITERKDKEAQLKTLSDRLLLATASAKMGIWDWDITEDVLTWDEQMYNLYGLAQEDFRGEYEMWARAVHPEDRPQAETAVQQAVLGMEDFHTEFKVVWPDQSVHTIQAHAIVQRDDAGKPIRMIGVNWDISDRKMTEERLRESEVKRIEALSQSDELKSALLASVSHELRTPLTAMKASVFSIIGNAPSNMDQEQQEFLKGIDKEINYMSHLVDNLLDMSQIEAGTLIPHKEWHPLEDLVEGALRRTEQTLDTRNVEIHIPEDVPPVFADAVEIQQVLTNLLDNAVKYSSPGSPIRIHVRAEVQQIEVQVSNNGETIQAQDLERIFERFYRRRSPRQQSIRGTGLGLAICKGIVEAHGGRIWAESIGKEVTITFTVPMTESMVSFSLEGLGKS